MNTFAQNLSKDGNTLVLRFEGRAVSIEFGKMDDAQIRELLVFLVGKGTPETVVHPSLKNLHQQAPMSLRLQRIHDALRDSRPVDLEWFARVIREIAALEDTTGVTILGTLETTIDAPQQDRAAWAFVAATLAYSRTLMRDGVDQRILDGAHVIALAHATKG